MPPQQQSRINTLVGIGTLAGIVVTVVFYLAPLRTLPGEMDAARVAQNTIRDDISEMRTTQAVQTEALKTLADVAKDSREMRRDVDRNRAELEGVKRRLERLER